MSAEVEFTEQERDSYEELRDRNVEESLQMVLDEAKKHAVLPPGATTEQIRHLVEVCRENTRLVMQYTPPPLELPVTMFRAEDTRTLEEASGHKMGEDLGWEPFLGVQMALRKAAGSHFTMMKDANAERLAADVNELLQAKED